MEKKIIEKEIEIIINQKEMRAKISKEKKRELRRNKERKGRERGGMKEEAGWRKGGRVEMREGGKEGGN